MSTVIRNYLPRPISPQKTMDAWTQEADAVLLPRLDEVGGHPRPSGIGVTYAEQEYHALAEEQELIWPAEGEREARRYQVRERGCDREAEATGFLLGESEQEVREAHSDQRHAARALTPYIQRRSAAKLWYWIFLVGLWFGDTAGVWSAAVTNGEIVYIAFGQAFAAGLSAVCAGLVGSQVKNLQMARGRQRDPESLTEDEQRYRRLFTGADKGVEIVKLIGLLSLTVMALLPVGVFALRSGVEDGVAAAAFGLFAAATAISSALLSYSAADEVADLLDAMAKRVHRAEKRHLKLASASPLKVRAEAEEAARSILAEYKLRGEAAAKRVESLGWRVQRRNPQVLGHGYPVGEQSGIIGRRSRRGGVA